MGGMQEPASPSGCDEAIRVELDVIGAAAHRAEPLAQWRGGIMLGPRRVYASACRGVYQRGVVCPSLLPSPQMVRTVAGGQGGQVLVGEVTTCPMRRSLLHGAEQQHREQEE